MHRRWEKPLAVLLVLLALLAPGLAFAQGTAQAGAAGSSGYLLPQRCCAGGQRLPALQTLFPPATGGAPMGFALALLLMGAAALGGGRRFKG